MCVELNENVSKVISVEYTGTDKNGVENKHRKTVTCADAVRTVVKNRDRETLDQAICSQAMLTKIKLIQAK